MMLKERYKGAIIGAAAATLIITMPAFGSAVSSAIQVTYRNLKVSVDGKSIATEQEPFIFEGRTYLAVRDIAEAFDAEIKMNESTDTVEITSRQAPKLSETVINQRPSNPPVTREQAEQIAINWLKENGITNARRDGGISMDFERGAWVWELEFENNYQDWDFYIDVNTSEITHIDHD